MDLCIILLVLTDLALHRYKIKSLMLNDDEYICDKWKYNSVYICFTLQRVLVNTGVHDAKKVVPRIVEEIPVTKTMVDVAVSINNLYVVA